MGRTGADYERNDEMKRLYHVAMTAALLAAFAAPTASAARESAQTTETATAADVKRERATPRAKIIWGD